MTTLSMIVAMARNRVIGREGNLPWHISEDLRRFKRITLGHPIIMGRTTFESIGRPLPGRCNIVLSRQPDFRPAGVIVAHSKAESLRLATEADGADEVFVIGGGRIYREFFDDCGRFYLTLVDQDAVGDATFPDVDWNQGFDCIESQPGYENGLDYKFVTYERHA